MDSRGLHERALDSLRRADGPLPLAEVGCRIVTENASGDTTDSRRGEVQRVYLALARYQIPYLECRGIVDNSEAGGTFRLTGPGTP